MYELCWRSNKRSLSEQRHVAENAGILHISNSGEGKGRVGGGKRLKDFKEGEGGGGEGKDMGE